MPEIFNNGRERQHNYSGDASWVDIRTLKAPFTYSQAEIDELKAEQGKRLAAVRETLGEIQQSTTPSPESQHNYSGDPEWIDLGSLKEQDK